MPLVRLLRGDLVFLRGAIKAHRLFGSQGKQECLCHWCGCCCGDGLVSVA